jgi:hypothetical protein
MRALRALLLAVAALAAPLPLTAQLRGADADSLRAWLRAVERDPRHVQVDVAETLRPGPRTIAAGERLSGDAVTFRGTLDVRGEVDGDAIALGGDVVLHPGARVTGDAVAVGGSVRRLGGDVLGEMVALSRAPTPALSPGARTRRAVAIATGWLVILSVIGAGVLLLAPRNLERIADTIEARFGRAFLWGLVGQLALFPVMALIVVALVVTILGILLIPFAIVAYFTAAAGALALGFLAMAYVAGEAVGARLGGALRTGIGALLLGLAIFYLAWLVPALLTWSGWLGGIVRLCAAAITWVALTVGFGAALLTRGGTREPSGIVPPAPPAPLEEDASYTWDTPTPVSGVAAARRPTPYPGRSGDLR